MYAGGSCSSQRTLKTWNQSIGKGLLFHLIHHHSACRSTFLVHRHNILHACCHCQLRTKSKQARVRKLHANYICTHMMSGHGLFDSVTETTAAHLLRQHVKVTIPCSIAWKTDL